MDSVSPLVAAQTMSHIDSNDLGNTFHTPQLSVNKVWLYWNCPKVVYNLSPGLFSICQKWLNDLGIFQT